MFQYIATHLQVHQLPGFHSIVWISCAMVPWWNTSDFSLSWRPGLFPSKEPFFPLIFAFTTMFWDFMAHLLTLPDYPNWDLSDSHSLLLGSVLSREHISECYSLEENARWWQSIAKILRNRLACALQPERVSSQSDSCCKYFLNTTLIAVRNHTCSNQTSWCSSRLLLFRDFSETELWTQTLKLVQKIFP